MKFCPNPRCEGRAIYEGVSCVNGKYIEYYRCYRCKVLHAVPAVSDDEDTQELPRVNVSETQS